MPTKELEKETAIPLSKMRRLATGHKVRVIDSTKRVNIDEERHEVTVDGNLINLAPKEFKVLALLKNSGKTMMRVDILKEVWGVTASKNMEERTVDQHIARLRKKISNAGVRGAEVVKTQNSFGYVYKQV